MNLLEQWLDLNGTESITLMKPRFALPTVHKELFV